MAGKFCSRSLINSAAIKPRSCVIYWVPATLMSACRFSHLVFMLASAIDIQVPQKEAAVVLVAVVFNVL